MRNFALLAAVVAALFAGTASADILSDNFSPEAEATGIGVGIGTGGDADATAFGWGEGGDAEAGAVAGAGVYGSGNSDATAVTGPATAITGPATAVNGPQVTDVDASNRSSNFNSNLNSNRNDLENTNVSVQGQHTDVDTTDVSVQGQGQDQGQGQVQGIHFSDNDTSIVKYKAAKTAAASAADIVLGTCQTGMSAQTHMGGGSMGSPDEVCLLFTASQLAYSQDKPELGDKLLNEAVEILRVRANPVRRLFQGIPLIGRLF